MSADEDEQLVLSTNEWTYPNIRLARRVKSRRMKHLGSNERDVVSLMCFDQTAYEYPCGAYDEALIPTTAACNLISDESRLKGKTRFQIMGITAEGQKDLNAIIRQHDIKAPTTGTTPFGEP